MSTCTCGNYITDFTCSYRCGTLLAVLPFPGEAQSCFPGDRELRAHAGLFQTKAEAGLVGCTEQSFTQPDDYIPRDDDYIPREKIHYVANRICIAYLKLNIKNHYNEYKIISLLQIFHIKSS